MKETVRHEDYQSTHSWGPPEVPKEPNELAAPLKFKFAFVSDGFCVSRGSNARWRGLPSALSAALFKEPTNNVLAIYGGPRGEFFLRTHSTYYSSGIPKGFPIAQIALVAFGPDGACFANLASDRHMWTNAPPYLIDKIEATGMSNIHSVTVGVGGRWVFTHGNGRWWSWNVPRDLIDKLRSVKHPKNIVLSSRNSYWFLEDGDGGFHYSLPKEWHDDVEHVAKG